MCCLAARLAIVTMVAVIATMGGIGAARHRPNIVFVLTDDQDLILNGMSIMDQTKKLIIDRGLTFNNAFVSSPVCCVSRASILSGRYVHNHHTHNNSLSGGCSNSSWQSNAELDTFAVHIANAGYNTLYSGKYLNQYGDIKAGGWQHIPPGWTEWYTLLGNSKYYDYNLSNNGALERHGSDYKTDYLTDLVKNKGLQFLRSQSSDKPWMIVLSTPAAHAPFTPAPQYVNTSEGEIAPRTPNFNIVGNDDKHALMRQVPLMTDDIIDQSDAIYRDRLGTLRSVDDMVAEIYSQVEKMGQIDNTYFIYASDHGFHLGQFGMTFDKRQLYEYDLRIPFYVSGPGIKPGVNSDVMALNVDIAPTLVELAVGTVPEQMDGRSLVPFFNPSSDETESTLQSDQRFYVEYYGLGHTWDEPLTCGNGHSDWNKTVCDSWNNTYHCIRSIDGSENEVNGTIYCQFSCFGPGHSAVQCDEGTPESEGEYYTLDSDPWAIKNSWTALSNSEVSSFESLIDEFAQCSGQTECNSLRDN